MIIYSKTIKNEVQREILERSCYLDSSIGFTASVIAVNSINNTCDVRSNRGIVYKDIAVMSGEWICKNNDFVSASRNLPPVGSVVFVLTPYKSIAGAFILGSINLPGDNQYKTLYAKDKSEKDRKDTTSEKVSVSGWNETENYKNGNKVLKSPSNGIVITMIEEDDSELSLKKGVTLQAFGTQIQITENVLNIKPAKDVELKIDGDIKLNVNGKTELTTSTFSVNDGSLEVS